MDTALNPKTGDYTGKVITTLANAVYLRLQTPLGSYWADPTLGSRLHVLAREKDVPRIRTLAIQYAEDALQPLLVDRRASAINVQAGQPHDGTMWLLISVTDATGDEQIFKHPVKVM